MKKIAVFAIIVIMTALAGAVIYSSVANAANAVIINPSNPSDNDGLVCYVAGSADIFDVFWYQNGQEAQVDYGVSQSTITAAQTNAGDEWKCDVYSPFGNKVGEAIVNIAAAGSTPQPANGTVIITPASPFDNETLSCSIQGFTGDADFTWLQNGNEFKTDYGVNQTTIAASQTSQGDIWKCSAYTPFGNKIGDASVTITVENTSVASGTVIITPSHPYTNDTLTGSVLGITESLDLYWYKNNQEFKIDYGATTTINPSDTTKHDVWTLKAYTPFGSFVNQASVEILNTAPVMGTVSSPVSLNEGQSLDVSFSATDLDNDALIYNIYRNGQLVALTNSSSWVTAVGDAGTYTYIFNASDGEASVTATRTVIVNPIGTPPPTAPVCGNSVIETGETCDDGNTASGDSCSSTCQIEPTPPTPVIPPTPSKKITIYNLEFSAVSMPEGNYLKIRNTAHKIDNAKIRIYATELNSVESLSLNVDKNEVKLYPLNFDLKNNDIYLLKINVISDNFDGSDYLLMET